METDPQALRQVRQMLRKALGHPEVPLPPEFMTQFLAEVWAPYLAMQLKERGDSVLAPAVRITLALLVSLSPAPTDENKRRLKAFLADMLPLVREALALSRWSPDERADFLGTLADWHIALIKTGEPPKDLEVTVDHEQTVPICAFTSEYREYLHLFERGVEVVNLDDVPVPWAPGSGDTLD